MHFWVILVKKTYRFLCSVRFQLQYPCIFLPIYLFPVKIRTKNQTNKSLLFHSSWFLKCNLQNEIMYKLMYHFYSASLKNTSKEYLMYYFYRNLSKVPNTASIWCLLSRSFMSYYLCKQWADLDAAIVDCMYSFLVYICSVLQWETEVCLTSVLTEKRIFFLSWFTALTSGIGSVCLITLTLSPKMDRKTD